MLKKNIFISMLLIAAVLAIVLVPMTAQASDIASVMVNNQPVTSNAAPEVFNGALLAPAKELSNSLGGTFTYDSASMTGTVRQGENELVFRLDSSIVKFNGKFMQAPAPMKISGNRIMIPVKFSAEKLGAECYMDVTRNILMVFQGENGKVVYKVMPGDTLWRIYKLFGTPVSTLVQLNRLNSYTIYLGQKLVIKDYSPASIVIRARVTRNATLRIGPGFGFDSAGYIPALAEISVTGKNGDWYRVITPKGNGYIYFSIMEIIQEISDNSANSTYFSSRIALDTSENSIAYIQYTVQNGDTLWSISEKFGITINELATANSLSLSSYLKIGQVLSIPVHNIPEKVKLGPEYGEVLDWSEEGQYVFPIGKVGKFIDLETGKSFMAMRTIGASHSDTETITAGDTQTMKEIFGGSWSWNRRSFILEVDGRRFAVSIAGMPHAGVDGAPFLQNVSNRSDNWGYGPNYDKISGNGMDGHFDVYFLNSLKHNNGSLDSGHQYKVMVAGGLQ